MTAWLTVVGVGDDGPDGLSPAARTLIDTAEVLVGGARHLDRVADDRVANDLTGNGGAERLTWRSPLDESFAELAAHKGRRVTVLATGDPTWFGVGTSLVRQFGAAAVYIVPAPGAFSLACARLGWALQDVTCLSLHGNAAVRGVNSVRLHLGRGRHILALANDGTTPAAVAQVLSEAGFGGSTVTVLAHLGGADEDITAGRADELGTRRFADLNTIAIACDGDRIGTSRVPGLPDDAFDHDGQLTKRAVRAATLSLLAPTPGTRLWDLGAGCGSVAIEWLRALGRHGDAVAVERDAGRCAMIARNANHLGVPHLEIVQSDIGGALRGLAAPDAVFVGGGLTTPEVFDVCRSRLSRGGRIVANAVTVEGEAVLLGQFQNHGGDLRRVAISDASPVGDLTGWRPAMPVTQYWWAA